MQTIFRFESCCVIHLLNVINYYSDCSNLNSNLLKEKQKKWEDKRRRKSNIILLNSLHSSFVEWPEWRESRESRELRESLVESMGLILSSAHILTTTNMTYGSVSMNTSMWCDHPMVAGLLVVWHCAASHTNCTWCPSKYFTAFCYYFDYLFMGVRSPIMNYIANDILFFSLVGK